MVKFFIKPLYVFMIIMLGMKTGKVFNARLEKTSILNTGKLNLATKTTAVLNAIFKEYNIYERPSHKTDRATNVIVDINIRSMGTNSDKETRYSMQMYFRQIWVDERLKISYYNESQDYFSNATLEDMDYDLPSMVPLDAKVLKQIWQPNTLFMNGHFSYVHSTTTPNKLVRLSRDGTILYSQRLTVQAKCPMDFHSYPLDVQNCPLLIASTLPATHVVYRWKRKPIISEDLKLSSFEISDVFIRDGFQKGMSKENHSVLKAVFRLKRHTGYYIIDVYMPCTLLVVLSWVSFIINRSATADRVTLSITSILATAYLVIDVREKMPELNYPTALDFYMVLCFFYVSSTLVEFTVVHYFTKRGTGDLDLMTTATQQMWHQRLQTMFNASFRVSNGLSHTFKFVRRKIRAISPVKTLNSSQKNSNNVSQINQLTLPSNNIDMGEYETENYGSSSDESMINLNLIKYSPFFIQPKRRNLNSEILDDPLRWASSESSIEYSYDHEGLPVKKSETNENLYQEKHRNNNYYVRVPQSKSMPEIKMTNATLNKGNYITGVQKFSSNFLRLAQNLFRRRERRNEKDKSAKPVMNVDEQSAMSKSTFFKFNKGKHTR